MFVQVITGKAADAAGLRRQLDTWRDELKPGATGFLGSTGGIADDGSVVMVARFADEAAAQANGSRAEQDAWWQETAKYFTSEPTFRDSSDVTTFFDGGSDDAGFVQVIDGRGADRAKAEAVETPEMLEQLRKARPDLLGGLRIWFGDDYVEVAYFTSEVDARKNETSAEFSEQVGEFVEQFGELTYTDLRDPLFA